MNTLTNDNFGEKLKIFYIEYIRQFKSRKDVSFSTVYLSHAYHGIFEGMASQEIEQLKLAQEVKTLPRIYVEFLEIMGHKAGGIFVGCSISFEELLILKKALLNMMKENRHSGMTIPTLPDEAFVFLGIQGVDFFFFEANNNDNDPPVFYYMDGAKKYHEVASSLSSWFWKHAFDPTKITQQFLED
jgi:hypothetical protein